MQKIKLALILFFALLLTSTSSIYAQENCEEKYQCNSDDDNYALCLNNKKSCLEKVLAQTREKKTTLENAIGIINGNINIQQVKISQTKNEISKLESEIVELDNRISGLNISLDRLTTLLVERIRTQYKREQINPLSVLAASKSFASFLSQYRYLLHWYFQK